MRTAHAQYTYTICHVYMATDQTTTHTPRAVVWVQASKFCPASHVCLRSESHGLCILFLASLTQSLLSIQFSELFVLFLWLQYSVCS